MAWMASLYDCRNEKYPVYHSGILTFVITTFLPLNLGFSKLPFAGVVVILGLGFTSLFMLARNEKVGADLLGYLKIKNHNNNFGKKIPVNSSRYRENQLCFSETKKCDPLVLLENFSEHIVMNHEEHLDKTSLARLGDARARVLSVSRKICKLDV